MELLEVGGRTVAVGLFWQPRESARKRLKVEARELAEQLAAGPEAREFSHVALRPRHQEYGLAERIESLPPNVLALAGVLADHANGKWAGRYALADGRHWVVCVIDGQVLADGDVVLEDGEAAAELIANWRASYPELEAEAHDAPEAALGVLAEHAARARGPLLVPLASTALAAGIRKLIVGAALAAGVGFAGLAWFGGEEPAKPGDWAARVTPVAPPAPSQPVPRRPERAIVEPTPAVSPVALGTACVTPYLVAPLQVDGWWIAEWRCVGTGTLAIAWRRGADGSFVVRPPGAELAGEDPNAATEARALALPPPRAIAAVPLAEANAALYEVARLYGLELNVSWPAAETLPPGVEVPGQVASATPFYEAEFTLNAAPESGAPPRALFEALARVRGLALRSLAWHEDRRRWSYDGVLYARRPAVR